MVPDQSPSDKLLSRRNILVSTIALGVTGLAGCSGEASSDSAECSTTALEHGDSDILQQVTAMMSGESVELLVSLQESGDALPIGSILIEDSQGNLEEEIPTTEAQEYRITIGSPPHHGRLTLLAVNEQRDNIDSMEIEYHCTEE